MFQNQVNKKKPLYEEFLLKMKFLVSAVRMSLTSHPQR